MKCDFNGRHDSLAQNQTGPSDGISKNQPRCLIFCPAKTKIPTLRTQFLSDMSVAVSVSDSDEDILAEHIRHYGTAATPDDHPENDELK